MKNSFAFLFVQRNDYFLFHEFRMGLRVRALSRMSASPACISDRLYQNWIILSPSSETKFLILRLVLPDQVKVKSCQQRKDKKFCF